MRKGQNKTKDNPVPAPVRGRVKRRILVVDDEAAITRLLKLNIEQTERYLVRTENTARQALAAADEFQPDLILLDLLMPGMDGGELVAQLQTHPRVRGVPIVVLTGAATRQEFVARGGLVSGMPFLAKPVGMPEVLHCLEQHLGGSRAAKTKQGFGGLAAP